VRAIGNNLHMDYSAVGQTTHLAARMEQLAPPGSSRLTAATCRLSVAASLHFGKILGILDMGFGLGAALGSYLTGVLFDRYQTYQPSFYMVIGLILVSILTMWLAAPRLARTQSGAFASSPAES
jgi:hypothetical protein